MHRISAQYLSALFFNAQWRSLIENRIRIAFRLWRRVLLPLVVWCVFGSAGLDESQADDFVQPFNTEPDSLAAPMDAHEAAAGFQVPDGIQAEAFASEPDVQNPIAMAWDGQGRLWVAENYTYAERTQRFELGLRDRVIILDDTDRDGRSDQRSVFTDQVQMLTGLELGHGGAWLMCPPQLLFIPDAELDGQPDGPARVMLDGFDVALDNYHNFANGLRWGPDGWLYGRCGGSCPGRVGLPGSSDASRTPLEGGLWRYNVQTQHFEVLCHGTTNPWGHDWDAWGECFFINTVNGHLWHLIPGAHFARPFTLDPNPHVFEAIDMHADHWHFDTTGQWFQSRNGQADSYGGGHAHVGMLIYQADNWPAGFRDRLFTWNIHGRRVNQEILQRHGSGYIGRHGPDILQASDPFFRGMDLSCGPDGAVYAIDWSDTGECHEHTGVHRTSGRVFRFATSQSHSQLSGDLRSRSCQQLAQLHTHTNQWFVRQSRLILSERSRGIGDCAGIEEPIQWLSSAVTGQDDRLAYECLLTLHAMGRRDHARLLDCLAHRNEHLRTWAIRCLLDDYPIDDVLSHNLNPKPLATEALERLVTMARHDESGLVRLALASALQRLPVQSRPVLAESLLSRGEDAEDHNLPLMVWYGLIPVAETMPLRAAELTEFSQWPKTTRLIARQLSSYSDMNPQAVERLLAIATAHPERRLEILQGISDGLRGLRQVDQPSGWVELIRVTAASDDHPAQLSALIQELSILFGDGTGMDQIRQQVLDSQADISLRRSALEMLVRHAPPDIVDICLPLLKDARLNWIAVQGLASSSDTGVADALIKHYFQFRPPQRPQVIATLTARTEFAERLLTAIAAGRIPKHHLTAYDVRQIQSLGSDALIAQVEQVWGRINQSTAQRRQRIEQLRAMLTAGDAPPGDPSQGRVLFQRHCSQCHRLLGSGSQIGPDLTGGNRQDLDFWLENIVDPSAVVARDFYMSTLQMVDGRVLSGLVVSRSENAIELRTPTELLTLATAEIESQRTSAISPMPDGLLDALDMGQIRDLISYLRHPTQVALPLQ
ncbi:MAG: c-type cytochrome [Pirellulaceae bacterium]|nr:c-type cytochrome [Pirellulaceae bacterium]